MKTKKIFDVLIIYDEAIANGRINPFPLNSKYTKYNDVYYYFLLECKKKKIHAAFATTGDIIGAGTCSNYWTQNKNKWVRHKGLAYSQLIFDKFSPRNDVMKIKRDILFSSSEIHGYKDSYLSELFNDKQKTHDALAEYAIPTTTINGYSRNEIKKSLIQLAGIIQNHKGKSDFSNVIILKDRNGAGGNNIFKVSKNISDSIYNIIQKGKEISYIIQPCMKFDKGYTFKNHANATEIRFVYLQDKIVQMYIRIAGNDEFICNYGSGGIEITHLDVPQKLTDTANEISTALNRKNSLYALDFIVSNNNNIYLLEGNISPGIDWDPSNLQNTRMNQKMIRMIVSDLKHRKYKNRIITSKSILPILNLTHKSLIPNLKASAMSSLLPY